MSSRKAENVCFDGLLFRWKGIERYVSWHCRVMQSLENNWLLVPKMTWRISWILMQTVTNLKICTLMCYFCRRYIIFKLKKYTGVMCHNTEERFGEKNLDRNWLVLWKTTLGSWWILTQHSNVSKFALLRAPFDQSI